MQTAANLDVYLNHSGVWSPGPTVHCLKAKFCRNEALWNNGLGRASDCLRDNKEFSRIFSSKGSRVGLVVCHPGVVT